MKEEETQQQAALNRFYNLRQVARRAKCVAEQQRKQQAIRERRGK